MWFISFFLFSQTFHVKIFFMVIFRKFFLHSHLLFLKKLKLNRNNDDFRRATARLVSSIVFSLSFTFLSHITSCLRKWNFQSIAHTSSREKSVSYCKFFSYSNKFCDIFLVFVNAFFFKILTFVCYLEVLKIYMKETAKKKLSLKLCMPYRKSTVFLFLDCGWCCWAKGLFKNVLKTSS